MNIIICADNKFDLLVTSFINTSSCFLCNEELRGINWSQHIDEYALLRLPSGQAVPAGFTVGRPYYLGFGQVYSNLILKYI